METWEIDPHAPNAPSFHCSTIPPAHRSSIRAVAADRFQVFAVRLALHIVHHGSYEITE